MLIEVYRRRTKHYGWSRGPWIAFRIVFFCIALWGPAPWATAADPVEGMVKFDHLTPQDGLAGDYVPATLQDRYGFIWIATENGLNRYDGHAFTLYQHQPEDPRSLSYSDINTLFEDEEGTLWAGTVYGLNRYDRATDDFTRYLHDPDDPDSLGHNRIRHIDGGQGDDLWIATLGGGLSRLNRRTGTFERYRHDPADPESLSHNQVWVVHVGSDGALWAGTTAGLDRFHPETGTFHHYVHDSDDPSSLGGGAVKAIFESSAGRLWVGTQEGGLSRLDPESDRFVHYGRAPAGPASTNRNGVNAITERRDGSLWIGSQNGLIRLDADTGTFTHYENEPGNPHGLNEPVVLSLMEDREGTLWIGTMTGGLNLLTRHGRKFAHFYHHPKDPNSLTGNQVRGIHGDREGNLWIGTVGGGLNRMDSRTGRFTHYLPEPGNPRSLSLSTVNAVTVDRDGHVWAGTWGGGACRLDPETGIVTRYSHDPADPESIGGDYINCFLEDPEGRIWVGTWGGGLSRFDPNRDRFVRFRHDPADPASLGDDRPLDLVLDESGNLWIGLAGHGVDRYDPETESFIHYPDPDRKSSPFNSLTVLDLFEAADGTLWIGATTGLYGLDPDTGTVFARTGENGPPANAIRSIREDDATPPRLWLGTNRGLYRFNPTTGDTRRYGAHDGLQGVAFVRQSSWKSRDGVLYFGGNNGFNRFHPGTLTDNPMAPPVVLTGFRLFNRSVTIGRDSPLPGQLHTLDRIRLDHDQNTIGFELAALSYIAPEKNRYAYRLEGLDADWVHVGGDRRFVQYTQLPPGGYTFRARAANPDGIWNETGVSLEIIVTPPWWETMPFRAAAILLILAAVYGGFQWRVHSIRGRNRELERQVAERTHDLRESEERFATVVNSMEAVLYVADMTSYELLFINDYTRRQFGDGVGRICWRTLQSGQTGPCPFCTNSALVRDGKPTGVYQWEHHNSVTGRWYHVQDRAIRWTDGRLVRLEIANDITPRKEVELALEQARKDADAARRAAESANQAKSTFLANMSHELRTPLNAILGFSELMAGDENLTEDQRENLGIIGFSGEHLLSLINNVLELSKIEAGRITFESSELDLYQMVSAIEDMFRLQVEGRGLALIVELKPDLPRTVIADEGKLRQVIINLLGNAVKFTADGRIILRVAVEGNDPLVLCFEVEDTGVGISPEELDKVFDVFVQTDSGRQIGEGTGLGLPISREYVRMMGGDLIVNSRTGEGTCFRFSVPVGRSDACDLSHQPRSTQTVSLAPDQSAPDGGPYRILVVDDVDANRQLLVSMLNPLGLSVREAVNGEEAVATWEGWRPHLILMDIRMPVLDGYAATREIRSRPEGGDTVIIAVTAGVFEEQRAEVLAAGCDDFVRKPFRRPHILEILRRYLGLRYLHEDEGTDPSCEDDVDPAKLPNPAYVLSDEALRDLKEAAITGRFFRILEIVQGIRPDDPNLSKALNRWANDFKYAEILSWINRGDER